MYDIVLYEDARGNSPVQTFLKELDEKAATDKSARILLKKIYYCMELLERNGTRNGEKFTKPIKGVKEPLWEVRPDDHRIFFFMWNGNHIVLLHSFKKEGNDTPEKEIKLALKEMKDWIKRHEQ